MNLPKLDAQTGMRFGVAQRIERAQPSSLLQSLDCRVGAVSEMRAGARGGL
jgi:hypothetical protein